MYKIRDSVSNRISQFCFHGKEATSNIEIPVFTAPENCKVQKISFVNKSAITRSDTACEQVIFKDKGSDGTGTDVIISGCTANTLSGGVALAAFNEINMEELDTNASLNATYSVLSKGDVVSVQTISGSHVVSGSSGLALGEAAINIYYVLTDIASNVNDA